MRGSRNPSGADKYSLPNARTTASPSVSARCRGLGGCGSPAAGAAELRQPRCSRKYGGNETGYAQIDIEPFPVEATASSKDFDRTDVFTPGSLKTRYQSYRQRDVRSVCELDPQCVLLSAVDDSGSPRLRIRRTAPGARGAREIC